MMDLKHVNDDGSRPICTLSVVLQMWNSCDDAKMRFRVVSA